mmetsp:Transcript_18718/g.52067  ORF Transcript_18718/g.52067 Transcript_18718/m.52067 type:complete len:233 (-) Transcript_18718:6-704(-)
MNTSLSLSGSCTRPHGFALLSSLTEVSSSSWLSQDCTSFAISMFLDRKVDAVAIEVRTVGCSGSDVSALGPQCLDATAAVAARPLASPSGLFFGLHPWQQNKRMAPSATPIPATITTIHRDESPEAGDVVGACVGDCDGCEVRCGMNVALSLGLALSRMLQVSSKRETWSLFWVLLPTLKMLTCGRVGAGVGAPAPAVGSAANLTGSTRSGRVSISLGQPSPKITVLARWCE